MMDEQKSLNSQQIHTLRQLLRVFFHNIFRLRSNETEIGNRLDQVAELVALAHQLRDYLPAELIENAASELELPTPGIEETNVVDGYRLWSEDYDRLDNPLILVEEPIVIPALGDVRGKRIADIGCGTGRYCMTFSEMGAAQVIGVDLTHEMLAKARHKANEAHHVKFVRGSVDQIPLDSEQFDVVMNSLVLCHLPDLQRPIQEMSRLLAPGGKLIIGDFHPACLLLGIRTSFTKDETHYRIQNYLHRIQDYVGAMLACGLQIESIQEPLVSDTPPDINPVFSEIFGHVPLGLILMATKPA